MTAHPATVSRRGSTVIKKKIINILWKAKGDITVAATLSPSGRSTKDEDYLNFLDSVEEKSHLEDIILIRTCLLTY